MLPDDDKKLVERLQQYQIDSESKSVDYRNQITRHLEYWRGNQWSSEQVAKANETTPPKPLLTINLLFKYLNTMSGFERNSRQDAKAFPVGRGADPVVADLLNTAIKMVDNQSLAVFHRSDLYLNGHIADRAHIRWKIRYNKMWPTIDMEALDSRDVYEDPEGDSYDFDPKHRFVNVCNWMWQDEVIAKYADTPDEEKHIKERLDSSRVRTDQRFFKGQNRADGRQLVNVIECQYRDFKKFIWAFNPQQRHIVPDVKDTDIKALVDAGYIINVDAQPISYIARISGDLLLENIPHYLPNGWFDISRYSPYFAMGQDVSMLEQLISQQDELNANRTSMRELIGRAPKGTILYSTQAGLSREQVENMSALGGIFEVTDLNQIKVMDTSGYYQALSAFVALYNAAKEEFEGITGVSEVLLGQLKSSTSGIVFNAARQQAAIGLQAGLDNLQRTLKIHYRKLIPILQKFFPADKLLRLTDDQYPALEDVAKAQAGDQQAAFAVYSPPNIDLLDKYRNAIATISADVQLGDFDIIMDFGQQAVTNMQANLMLALQIAQTMPSIAPYIADLMVDMSGFPQKALWVERIRQAQGLIQQQQVQQQQAEQIQTILKAQGGVAQLQNAANAQKPNGV
jgi:hypothetical protein